MSSDAIMLDLLRRDFLAFSAKAFNVLNPGVQLVSTLGFLAVAHKLSEVIEGKCRRLIINVPPRSGKSLLGSVALPSFALGKEPTRRVICASYSGELAAKFARDCRMIMHHESYRRLFPGTVITGKNTETELQTGHGGFRYATSVGGTLTGRGGNLIIVDDPQKPDQAMSAAGRDTVWHWFTQTLGSRLDNKSDDAVVVIMQRLHVDDLTGRLLVQGGWELLSIPAIADQPQTLTVRPGRNLVREEGHVLDPAREPLPVLEALRRELGTSTFEAQYQQRPVPPEGGLIKRQWLRFYDHPPIERPDDLIVQSWDTAYKPGEHNDYSVCTTWRLRGEQAFLIDLWRQRVDFPTLQRNAAQLRKLHQADLVLIEDTGSGISLIQALEREGLPARKVKPTSDKITRMSTASVVIEAGRVLFPQTAGWLDELVSELMAFPNGAHDDIVDSVSQFLNWLHERSSTPQLWCWAHGRLHPVSADTSRMLYV